MTDEIRKFEKLVNSEGMEKILRGLIGVVQNRKSKNRYRYLDRLESNLVKALDEYLARYDDCEKQDGYCPYAAPLYVSCQTCLVSPCPLGLDAGLDK